MMHVTRRDAMKLGLAAGALAFAERPEARAAAATDTKDTAASDAAAADARVVVAVIGVGGMGSNHVGLLSSRRDVELAAVCDVDADRLANAAQVVEQKTGQAPRATRDMRDVFADPRIDAVFIATPDHWHAPAAILALGAGKHVYVEKPCCHNIREGRLLVEAARAAGKHVQVGTQSRSGASVIEAIERVKRGEIGEVLVAKAWNSQRRGTIGRATPMPPPPQLDFDAWLGPAPETPYRSNLLPGSWRWFYDFGCGDMGNDGVHDSDVALWGLGVVGHPSRASGSGRKLFFDDDQQFPDTQSIVFDYDPAQAGGRARQFVFEQRLWSPYVQEGYENGAAFYGTEGLLLIGHTVGWKLFGPKNTLLAERDGGADLSAHHDNFLNCVRGKERSTHADAWAGHLAATCVHLGNIVARLQRDVRFDPEAEAILGDDEAHALVARRYRNGHWAVPAGGTP